MEYWDDSTVEWLRANGFKYSASDDYDEGTWTRQDALLIVLGKSFFFDEDRILSWAAVRQEYYGRDISYYKYDPAERTVQEAVCSVLEAAVQVIVHEAEQLCALRNTLANGIDYSHVKSVVSTTIGRVSQDS